MIDVANDSYSRFARPGKKENSIQHYVLSSSIDILKIKIDSTYAFPFLELIRSVISRFSARFGS